MTRLEQLCSQQDGTAHQYGDHGWETKLENAADLAKDGVVTIDGNGDVLAFALVTYELRPNEAHAYLEGRVIPALRRRGVGTALIEWSEARAGEHLDTIADGRTKVVRVLSYDGGPDAVALYERRGLRLQYAEHELRLVLDGAIPRIPLPAELSIEAYQADAAPEFYQVYTASFGTRTAQLWDFATWHYQVAEGDFHPELFHEAMSIVHGSAPQHAARSARHVAAAMTSKQRRARQCDSSLSGTTRCDRSTGSSTGSSWWRANAAGG